MERFTLPAFKKELAKKKKEDLIKEISSLCQQFPQVKEYYKSQYGDPSDILKKYIDVIEKEFVEGKTRGMPKARISVAKKAVKDFRNLISDADLVVDVMLTFVECISNFNDEELIRGGSVVISGLSRRFFITKIWAINFQRSLGMKIG